MGYRIWDIAYRILDGCTREDPRVLNAVVRLLSSQLFKNSVYLCNQALKSKSSGSSVRKVP